MTSLCQLCTRPSNGRHLLHPPPTQLGAHEIIGEGHRAGATSESQKAPFIAAAMVRKVLSPKTVFVLSICSGGFTLFFCFVCAKAQKIPVFVARNIILHHSLLPRILVARFARSQYRHHHREGALRPDLQRPRRGYPLERGGLPAERKVKEVAAAAVSGNLAGDAPRDRGVSYSVCVVGLHTRCGAPAYSCSSAACWFFVWASGRIPDVSRHLLVGTICSEFPLWASDGLNPRWRVRGVDSNLTILLTVRLCLGVTLLYWIGT